MATAPKRWPARTKLTGQRPKAKARQAADGELVEDFEREDDEVMLEARRAKPVDLQLGKHWERRTARCQKVGMHPEMVPQNADELERCLADPEWRMFSGCLYQIIVKGEGDDEDLVMPFKPNRAQKRFIKRLWHRNIILKARQLGFTTLIALMWLDHALFNGNQRCGMIAQDRETAEQIFRDKIVFAYDHLPEEIRDRMPLARASTKELLFAHNNSSIRVATSVRGGTIHRLHVSEFGKICAKFPAKADEVVTGSIQAVPKMGILVIESTAEGTSGEFYEMCKRSMALVTGKQFLTPSQYRFHFYAWWQDPAYEMDPSGVPISREEHEYFDKIEEAANTKIDMAQRAWYMEKARNDFSGKEERMWREYPATPEEAFQQSTEGHYYANEMVAIRKRGAIRELPLLDLPVYTFWDLGNSDGCAIWFMQEHDGQDRFIGYYEEHGMDLQHYAKMLLSKGYLFGAHFLPHDGNSKPLSDTNKSIKDQLLKLLPGQKFVIVPRIGEIMAGIQTTRKWMKSAWYDIDGCKQGMSRIENYRKKYSQSEKRWLDDEPDKANGCSEGADALRQYAQAKESGLLNSAMRKNTYVEAPAPIYA